jgi:hypothetical protein
MDVGKLAISFGVPFVGSLLGGAITSASVAFFVSDWAIQRHEAASTSTFEGLSSRFDSVDERLDKIEGTLTEIQVGIALGADPLESEAFRTLRDDVAVLTALVDSQIATILELARFLGIIAAELDISLEGDLQ